MGETEEQGREGVEFDGHAVDIPPEFVDPEGDGESQDPDLKPVTRGSTSTSRLRQLWADWFCGKSGGQFANIDFYGRKIGGVPVKAVDAYAALEGALKASGYEPSSSWAFNCRKIGGSNSWSLHSYGIAIDIDPQLNPHAHGDRYSGAIKKRHVDAVLAIKNPAGKSVWSWGGDWSKPDRMHFQLDQGPNDVAVDWSSATSVQGSAVEGLKRGAKGRAVQAFQELLLRWNAEALPEFGADSDYGKETETWVKEFQQSVDLGPTGSIDGVTAVMLSTMAGVAGDDPEPGTPTE